MEAADEPSGNPGLTQRKCTFNTSSQEVLTQADPSSAAVFASLMFRERLNNDA